MKRLAVGSPHAHLPARLPSRRRPTPALAFALGLTLTFASAQPALAAQDDCPPGSVEKSEDGYTWCEPSVCADDAHCSPGYVCVPMALCMEVGVLSKAGAPDGGSRLVARQICAEGTCPQKQTCSDLKRCLQRSVAERMKKLPAPAPAASSPPAPSGSSTELSAPPPPGGDVKRCGCRVVGAPSPSGASLALAALAAVTIALRRRRR